MIFNEENSNLIVNVFIEENIQPGVFDLVTFLPGSITEGQTRIHLTKATKRNQKC
jgi:hypothetical protein